eukprot:PhM_4_TR14642/c0_g1_i1/m.62163
MVHVEPAPDDAKRDGGVTEVDVILIETVGKGVGQRAHRGRVGVEAGLADSLARARLAPAVRRLPRDARLVDHQEVALVARVILDGTAAETTDLRAVHPHRVTGVGARRVVRGLRQLVVERVGIVRASNLGVHAGRERGALEDGTTLRGADRRRGGPRVEGGGSAGTEGGHVARTTIHGAEDAGHELERDHNGGGHLEAGLVAAGEVREQADVAGRDPLPHGVAVADVLDEAELVHLLSGAHLGVEVSGVLHAGGPERLVERREDRHITLELVTLNKDINVEEVRDRLIVREDVEAGVQPALGLVVPVLKGCTKIDGLVNVRLVLRATDVVAVALTRDGTLTEVVHHRDDGERVGNRELSLCVLALLPREDGSVVTAQREVVQGNSDGLIEHCAVQVIGVDLETRTVEAAEVGARGVLGRDRDALGGENAVTLVVPCVADEATVAAPSTARERGVVPLTVATRDIGVHAERLLVLVGASTLGATTDVVVGDE